MSAAFACVSERWGFEKPAAGFFERLVEAAGPPPEKIAYVCDRVDNDTLPALAAVHICRRLWAYLHEPPPAARRIRALAELAAVLRG